MQTQAAEVVSFATAQKAKRLHDTGEITFADIGELCAFLQHEIFASKLQYSMLARRCNLCPQTVSNIASGETKSPRASTVFAILIALGFEIVARR